jgi:hypothetical protein
VTIRAKKKEAGKQNQQNFFATDNRNLFLWKTTERTLRALEDAD